MWNSDPPQGKTSEQELVIIGRPPIPRFGAPQGSQVLIPQILDTMVYEFTDWFDLSWLKRIPVTIKTSVVPSTQNNFPFLINSTFTDLIDESEAELRFAGVDKTQLEYEIQSFNSLTGELIAWVLLPSISDSDIVYVYYDNDTAVDEQNPPAVWDVNYKTVLHLNNNENDSTINAQDFTAGGNYVNSAGQIGVGGLFVGAHLIRNPYTVFPTTQLTIDFWIKSITGNDTVASYAVSGNIDQFITRMLSSLEFGISGDIFNSGISVTSSSFEKITMTWDSITGNVILYKDGIAVASGTVSIGEILVNGGSLVIGRKQGSVGGGFSESLTGELDEFRISDIVRSADWILTESNNQKSPNAFYNIDAFESAPLAVIPDSMAYESDDWFEWNYLQRTSVTINGGQVPSTQNNFPFLINSTFTELQGKTEDGIRFTDVNNIAFEFYDIQNFNPTTGELIAWILLPSISDGDVIHIYSDNATAIDKQNPNAMWNNYISRWSLSDTPGGVDSIIDSTVNPKNGTPMGTMQSANGLIGNALSFDGLDDYIELGPIPIGEKLMMANSDIAISCIIKPVFGGDIFQRIIEKSDGISGANGYGLTLRTDEIILYHNGIRIMTSDPVIIDDTKFYHITATKENGVAVGKIYVNGMDVGGSVTNETIPNVEANMRIGTWNHDTAREYQGLAEEIRVTNIIPSTDKVTTEFNNYNSPSAFYSTGIVQNRPDESTLDTMGYEE